MIRSHLMEVLWMQTGSDSLTFLFLWTRNALSFWISARKPSCLISSPYAPKPWRRSNNFERKGHSFLFLCQGKNSSFKLKTFNAKILILFSLSRPRGMFIHAQGLPKFKLDIDYIDFRILWCRGGRRRRRGRGRRVSWFLRRSSFVIILESSFLRVIWRRIVLFRSPFFENFR